MFSTHLDQVFHLRKNQSLNIHCKPNERFLYKTHTCMKWVKMIYSNKISTKEVHQQNYLFKLSQITLTKHSKTSTLPNYLGQVYI